MSHCMRNLDPKNTSAIVTVEASSSTFAILKANVRVNFADNVLLFHYGVGDAPGQGSLFKQRGKFQKAETSRG